MKFKNRCCSLFKGLEELGLGGPFAMVVNMLILMAVYMLSRWMFYYMNMGSFPDVKLADMVRMSLGGLRFDLSALCYLNLLCIVLQFLPTRKRDTAVYQRIVKGIFLVVNILGIAVNCADIVYFEFGGRRTTATIFSEFGGESNLGKIFLNSITAYWQVWLFGILMILAIILLYCQPKTVDQRGGQPARRSASPAVYYSVHTVLFLLAVLLAIGGLRGGLGLKMHPMRQDSAEIYCNKPVEAAIVLNTPFTLLTTLHKSDYKDPHFFESDQLDAIFNPVKKGDGTLTPGSQPLNVVVFLLESFSREYTGFFNKELDGGQYQGYTPFLDSLMTHSYSFEYAFANGIRSVDCMPAAFAGIPRYINPFCYYLYANNTLQSLPQMLRDMGYTTAFFHGAPNTTLGFKAFTNSIGFERYYGMDEYGDKDFDGTWAIFDEPYLQYFAQQTDQIAKTGKTFFLTVFTASSHEPYRVPDQYKSTFTRSEIPMHRVISYADHALRQYFNAVKDKDWFRNTIFVFSADHTGPNCREDYNNEMGKFLIPIFFYTPGGQLPARCDSTRLVQQCDITPSLLGLLGYNKPYFSFGKNVFSQDSTYVNYVFNDWNGTSMYYLDSLMIEYHDNQLTGIYEFKHDFSLKNNLLERRDQFKQLPFMQRQIEAIIQQYVTRMKQNRLTATAKKR